MDIKKLTIIGFILLSLLIASTVFVAYKKPLLHKTFQLEQIIYKKAK